MQAPVPSAEGMEEKRKGTEPLPYMASPLLNAQMDTPAKKSQLTNGPAFLIIP